MIGLVSLLLFSPFPPKAQLNLSEFGVPVLSASTNDEVFRLQGIATAQQRPVQLENARRLARGQMAEVYGSRYASSDEETLKQAYTDGELEAQFGKLSRRTQGYILAYVKGVNEEMERQLSGGRLPAEIVKAWRPWTHLDSCAIAIRLLQTFGRGGAGELRNLALTAYLQGAAKDRYLDVLDDFAFQNEPTSLCTVSPADDRSSPTDFGVKFSRADSERHLSMLPKMSLLELMPLVRIAQREESTRVAQHHGLVSKTGSYCIVAGPAKSATGAPLLLSGPQMGFSDPSIVHEVSLRGRTFSVAGMSLPGVPGVLVGSTRTMAWGITTGAADSEDFFVVQDGDPRYPVTATKRTLRIAGGEPREVIRKTNRLGTILAVHSRTKSQFVRARAYEKRELASLELVFDLAEFKGTRGAEVQKMLTKVTMNFNAFFALKSGDIGWRFTGQFPIRASGWDPRFPVPASKETEWKGLTSIRHQPHTVNPSSGTIFNWNNKPAAWWPNLDTPVWGRGFRNESLAIEVNRTPKHTLDTLIQSAQTIAMRNENWPILGPAFGPGYAGLMERGPVEAGHPSAQYLEFVRQLRKEIFMGTTGNFVSDDLFELVGQAGVIANALDGKTKVDYLRGRTRSEIIASAREKAKVAAKATTAPAIRYADQPPIWFSNRGTYIQAVELGSRLSAKSILPPGNAESGPHRADQIAASENWQFKPMIIQE